MNVLFIHQNFPGQYLRLAQALRDRGDAVYGLGEAESIKKRGTLNGVTTMGYRTPAGANPGTHHYLQNTEAAVRRGQAVVRALHAMKEQGMKPDIICAHPGWGEALFIRDVFPGVPIQMLCEFYFVAGEADQGFDPEFPVLPDWSFSVRTRNAAQVLSILTADSLVSPTAWQASRYPDVFHPKMRIMHDGIDTAFMHPVSEKSITLQPLDTPGESRVIATNDDTFPLQESSSGASFARPPICLTKRNKIITYVSRNLEPYRGFHIFMRSLPAIQKEHPDAHILIAGGDGTSYSPGLTEGTYKEQYMGEVENKLDLERIHFLNRVPYAALRAMFQVSTAHVYLTYPFVLSWSVLEAMACECLVVASRTAPVEEVVTDGVNGILTDFFDVHALSQTVSEALHQSTRYMLLRKNARQHILDHYDSVACIQQQIHLLDSLVQ